MIDYSLPLRLSNGREAELVNVDISHELECEDWS